MVDIFHGAPKTCPIFKLSVVLPPSGKISAGAHGRNRLSCLSMFAHNLLQSCFCIDDQLDLELDQSLHLLMRSNVLTKIWLRHMDMFLPFVSDVCT